LIVVIVMNESELSFEACKLVLSVGEYSETKLRQRLANEENIVTFAATIVWFMANRSDEDENDLSPFEKMIWNRILYGIVRYWDPRSLGCPI